MEITEVRTREDMINNLKANGNYSKFKQIMRASRRAYSERMANYKISKSKENASDLKVEWKLIEGFDGIYSVSNYGEVKNNRTGKLMKPRKNEKGYLRIGLTTNGKQKCMRVHRLVAQAFIPNPENKPEVNHIDFNKENNCVNNLEWVTCKENSDHSFGNRKRSNEKNYKKVSNTGEKHISYQNGYYVVRMFGKKYFCKSFKNIEDAKKCRDEKIKEIYG